MSNEAEREAYHKWKAEAEPYGFNGFTAFQAGAEWQRSQQSAPAGYVMVPVEMIDSFPEINPYNYSHDQVCDLNAWGCDLVMAAIAATPKAEQSAPAGWHELLQEVAEYAPPYGTIVAMTSQMALGSKARRLLAAAPKAEHVQGIPDALRNAVEYLDKSELNSIFSGSILHREMKDAIDFPECAAPQPVSDDSVRALINALEVLAKLGNGEHYGNSDGNVIAQMALAAYRAAMGE